MTLQPGYKQLQCTCCPTSHKDSEILSNIARLFFQKSCRKWGGERFLFLKKSLY